MTPTSFIDTENQAGTLDLLMDMELPLLVRFGRTRMPLGELMKMGPGSVIEFGPSEQDAVEVVINGRVVARGVAVSVEGNYGVRITEIAASREGFDSGKDLLSPAFPQERQPR